jgi:hypothetical protein
MAEGELREQLGQEEIEPFAIRELRELFEFERGIGVEEDGEAGARSELFEINGNKTLASEIPSSKARGV